MLKVGTSSYGTYLQKRTLSQLAVAEKKAAMAELHSEKGHWGELSKNPSGGYGIIAACWRCGGMFKSKPSWKVWPQGPTCLNCRIALEVTKQSLYTAGANTTNFEAEQKPMKNGETKKLATSTAALWTDQWLVMGTAKAPYVVSKKTKTGEWQCSCPDWTKHTPRVDCKHILKIKLQEGVVLVQPKDKTIFDSVASTPMGGQKTALPAPKGRKFR